MPPRIMRPSNRLAKGGGGRKHTLEWRGRECTGEERYTLMYACVRPAAYKVIWKGWLV